LEKCRKLEKCTNLENRNLKEGNLKKSSVGESNIGDGNKLEERTSKENNEGEFENTGE